MRTPLLPIISFLGLASVLPCQAVEINIPDHGFTPDGSTTSAYQQTDIATPNGGNVLPAGASTHVAYFVTTFTFGENSDAHLQANFRATGGQARVGVEIQDTGLVQFIGTGDSTRTNFNFSQDMAGQTVTLLIKAHYDPLNNEVYGKTNASDDSLFNVWINPTVSSVEGSGQSAGDMQTVWNSATFGFFGQTIQNQSTLGTAGASSITNTVVLTGTDATFANALALATGGTPPTGIVDAGTSTVSASPNAVPADGTSTSTLTVTLKDAGGNPVAGKEVSLAGDTGNAAVETGNNTSDAGGVVVFTVKSSTVGTEVFSATGDSVPIAQTASVDFQEVVVVGPVDAGNSTVVASPASVAANGVATSTITVTLRDGNGLLIAGEDVSLGASPAGATISPAGAQASDTNGQAAFTVSSSTTGPVVFTATSVTDTVTISQTASVNFTDPEAAVAFNVNFIDEGQANATGLVGVVGDPGETWNQGTVAVSNLVDSTGTVVSPVNVSGLGNDGRTLNAALNVFDGNRDLFDKGGDVTLSITGLVPNTAYDLYIYSLSHGGPASWGNIASTERAAGDFVTANTVAGNGQSQYLDNATPGTNDSTFIPGGNYVVFESIITDGSGNISILVDAYDGTDGNPATDDGDCRLHVNGLQIRPASGVSVDYAAWRDTYYPGLGLPDEDDDGDGLSNDYERIFGLDPTDSASASPYTALFDPADGTFGYSRRTKSLINLNYKVWYSTNLVDWFEDNAANQTPESVTDEVEIMGVEIDPMLLAEPRLFVQVRATPISGVDPDPSLISLWGTGSTVTLLFSEAMNAASATNPANYTVMQDGVGALSISSATLSSDGATVTLTLSSALGINTGYTVTMDGLTSTTGQSLGNGTNRPFKTWDDNPGGIKVFILAGQSNMVGYGKSEEGLGGVPGAIGSLRYMAVNDTDGVAPHYRDLLDDPSQPATSPWKARGDVKVWWKKGYVTATRSVSKGNLSPTVGSTSGWIGPEYGFGQVIGDYYGGESGPPVLIIKCAWGGIDLAQGFRPPSAVAARGGSVGPYFAATIDDAREALSNLETEFPEWTGQGYQIVGFGWHQGYNDRISGSFSAEYESNLADFINDLRTVFAKPALPFSIGTTGMATGAPEPSPYTGYSLVEKGQLAVADPTQHPAFHGPSTVDTTDTRPFWRDSSVSPSSQGYHWNHNAESYYLIGHHMGNGMINLITTPP